MNTTDNKNHCKQRDVYIKMEININYRCPICFLIPIYEINETDFNTITITCQNNHIFNFSISDFFQNNTIKYTDIKCNHCLTSDINLNTLFYCIQCNKYICEDDKNIYHKNCNNIISINTIYSTCLVHNYPLTSFCIDCNKEICNHCFIEHFNHLLYENIQNILIKTKILINNENLEKIFIEKILKINENKEDYKIYNNIIKLLQLFNNIYLNEISNKRYSNVLYINIFGLHLILNKFKNNIVQKIIKKEKGGNNNGLKENNIIDNFEKSFTTFTQSDINKDNIIYNNKSNIFYSRYNKLYGKIHPSDSAKSVVKLLKDHKVNIIEIILKDINEILNNNLHNHRVIEIKTSNNKTNQNKISNYNNIINKYLVKNKNDIIIENDNNLSYNNLILNDFSSYHELPYGPPKGNRSQIILDNGYCLLLLDIFSLIDINRGRMKDEINKILILINPKNNYKLLLDFEYGVNSYIFPIYKNIFLISSSDNLYFYKFIKFFENIQLISHISDFKFEIYESYKFSHDICCLATDKGLLFYN